MAKGPEIPTTDSAEIEILIERLKQNKLERRDVELIERLLRTVLALVNLLQRKNMKLPRSSQPCALREFPFHSLLSFLKNPKKTGRGPSTFSEYGIEDYRIVDKATQ